MVFSDPANLWLAAGAALIAFEAFTAPGLGLFLAGFGAFCAALLTKAGVVDPANIPAQFAWFFGTTALWTVVLWKPLRKFRTGRRHGGDAIQNNNLVGNTAVVARGGITPGGTGQVHWSGTLMQAELDASAPRALSEGEKVHIHAVTGNTLKVTPQ